MIHKICLCVQVSRRARREGELLGVGRTHAWPSALDVLINLQYTMKSSCRGVISTLGRRDINYTWTLMASLCLCLAYSGSVRDDLLCAMVVRYAETTSRDMPVEWSCGALSLWLNTL